MCKEVPSEDDLKIEKLDKFSPHIKLKLRGETIGNFFLLPGEETGLFFLDVFSESPKIILDAILSRRRNLSLLHFHNFKISILSVL